MKTEILHRANQIESELSGLYKQRNLIEKCENISDIYVSGDGYYWESIDVGLVDFDVFKAYITNVVNKKIEALEKEFAGL